MITTLPGGNTLRSDYSGAMTTATDQVNRKTKRESDGLGRLIKVTEQEGSDVINSTTRGPVVTITTNRKSHYLCRGRYYTDPRFGVNKKIQTAPKINKGRSMR